MSDEIDPIAEAELRQKQLLEQLAASPVVVVSGIVFPYGVGGAKSRGEELWTMMFTLDGWRMGAAEVQTGALQVRRKVTEEELEEFRKLIVGQTIIRIRARVVADSLFGNPQALFEEYLGLDNSDAELSAHLERLRQPVTFADASFGEFTLDRGLNWFTGQAVWNGNLVSLSLAAKEPDEVEEALKTARSLWQSQDVWNRRIGDYAVQELLPLKNDTWLDENEAELTADQFKARMKLEAITAHPDGSFDFWHNDGDLFWGHSIEISGNLLEGPNYADIPG